MKKILVLSIQHTGTFFASATLAAAYPGEHLRIGSLYEKHRDLKHKRFVNKGPIELSDFIVPSDIVDDTFLDQAITSVCCPEDLAGKKIVIGHEHHHKPGSWLIKALTNTQAKVPIVIPVRDPLLSLHSKIWREIEQHGNQEGASEKQRLNRAKKWIKMFYEILSIPEEHVFKLPIDSKQSQLEESRVKLINDMYDYCKIPFNEFGQKAALEWKPANRTYTLIEQTDKQPAPRWENFKNRYNQRDINHTKAIMGLEWKLFNKEDKLKELMAKVGYEDVLWW